MMASVSGFHIGYHLVIIVIDSLATVTYIGMSAQCWTAVPYWECSEGFDNLAQKAVQLADEFLCHQVLFRQENFWDGPDLFFERTVSDTNLVFILL